MSSMQDSGDARSAIDRINREFVAAFVRKDAAAIAALYTVQGKLLPPRSDLVTGRAAIASYWREAMKIGIRKLETTELDIYADKAHEVGTYVTEGPGERVAEAGMYIVIWQREAGIWRMHRDIWNTR
jgi:ketosteroid isomerase-like protein